MPLLTLLALLAASPPQGAGGLLRAACEGTAADPGNAWALAHGLKALGPALKGPGNLPAAELLVAALLDPHPPATHPGLLLKALVVDARMPLDAPLSGPAGPVTLRALAGRAPWPFPAAPAPEAWQELPWTLDLLGATRRPGDTVPDAAGQPVAVDRLFDLALEQLEADDAELARGLAAGLPEVPKRHQGIYAHPCGGLHLVQAVLAWARHPEVRRRWGARVDAQLQVLLYRARSEERQLAAARALARREAPALEGRVLAQGLKFRGHFLETVARLERELGWRPDGPGEATVAAAAAALRAEVEGPLRPALEARARRSTPADDLGGDACHALAGLTRLRVPPR